MAKAEEWSAINILGLSMEVYINTKHPLDHRVSP